MQITARNYHQSRVLYTIMDSNMIIRYPQYLPIKILNIRARVHAVPMRPNQG